MKLMLKESDVLNKSYLKYRDLFEASDKYDLFIDKVTAKELGFSGFKRVLIVERNDTAALWFRPLLVSDDVTGALKMFHYHDVEVNNRFNTSGRLFIDDPENRKKENQEVAQKDIDKLMPGFSFFHNPRFHYFFNYIKDMVSVPVRERSIDLMFAGNTDFAPDTVAGAWISAKRKLCLENVKKLAGELNVLAVDGRCLTRPRYYESLRDSKVFLSPFGTGEYCGKDFEALMCGCIVVKPTLPGYCTFNPDYHDDIIYSDNFDNFGIEDFHETIHGKENDSYDRIRLKLLDAKANEIQIVKDILA